MIMPNATIHCLNILGFMVDGVTSVFQAQLRVTVSTKATVLGQVLVSWPGLKAMSQAKPGPRSQAQAEPTFWIWRAQGLASSL